MPRLTVVADACFTAPAVAFQAVSGVALVNHLGWPLESAPLAGKNRGLSPVLTHARPTGRVAGAALE